MNSEDPTPGPRGSERDELRFLNWIALVAVVDVVLLIPLVWASRWVADNHDLVSVLGPIHGFLFMALVGMVAWGSLRKWWGWWFPAIVVITLGPIGSLLGDWIVRRNLRATG